MRKKLKPWITIKNIKGGKDVPREVVIDKDGNTFIDGKLYDENNTKYKGLAVSVDKYNKLNTGEDTQKMIKSQKDAKEGETKIITEMKGKDKSESTTVKF